MPLRRLPSFVYGAAVLIGVGFVGLSSAAARPMGSDGASAATQPDAAVAQPAPSPTVVAGAGAALPAAAGAPSRPDAQASNAVAALDVGEDAMSSPDALMTAFRAYYRFRAEHGDEVHNPYLYFVDYGLGNDARRGWVFDMDALEVVDGPFEVAHGRGSSKSRNGIPTTFSNRSGSNASSLGVFVTENTYGFHGKSSGRSYSAVGLRLRGVSGRFNDAALRRGVVAHGAPYVRPHDAGRSEGCPAMAMDRAERLLPRIANGGVVVLYSPRDDDWLAHGPWVASSDARLAQ